MHVKSLQTKLCVIKKKSDVYTTEYLMEAKTIMGTLIVVGSSITDAEVMNHVINDLDDAYKSFLTYLHFHPVASFDELHTYLM